MLTKLLLVAALALPVTQSDIQRFAGIWTASFSGTTYVRLELKQANGTMAGTISLGDIGLDPQGAVNRATPYPQKPRTLFDVKPTATGLAFSCKDTGDTDRFEMRVNFNGSAGANGTAELHVVLSDDMRQELKEEGIPGMKPFPLRKIS